MKVFFLHYEVVPAQPTEEVQGGTADVCALAETDEEADSLARSLIVDRLFVPGALLASIAHTPPRIHGLDELESMLLAKALQRVPRVALHLSVWGAPRESAELRELPPLPEPPARKKSN